MHLNQKVKINICVLLCNFLVEEQIFYFLDGGSSWFQRLLKSWSKYQFYYFGNIEHQQHHEIQLFSVKRVLLYCNTVIVNSMNCLRFIRILIYVKDI